MMMREARIVLPVQNGNANAPEHTWLRSKLCRQFGGFTESIGRGGWISPIGETIVEPISIYDVAMDGDGQELIAIARQVGEMAAQDCVYVRLPDGAVEFVHPAPAPQIAAAA